jgi:hypothetical protein
MRVLLDESVPSRLRRSLVSHEVRTVEEMGWSGTKNGKLLSLAGAAFDAFATVDKNLPYQQNLASLPLAVVLLDSHSVELQELLPLVPALEQALLSLAPKTFVRVVAGA